MRAGASFIQSPVTATTCPAFFKIDTILSLSTGAVLENKTWLWSNFSKISLSVIFSNSSHFITKTGFQSFSIPTFCAIAFAVKALSQVTTETSINA